MEQNFVMRVNTKSRVGFRLVNTSCFEHALNPQYVGFFAIVIVHPMFSIPQGLNAKLRNIIDIIFINIRYLAVASLAVADCLVGCSAILFLCNRFIVERMNGDQQTVVVIFMVAIYTGTGASSFHLVVLAVDRLVAARYPIDCRRLMTTRRLAFLIAACWLIAFGQSTVYLIWLPANQRQRKRGEFLASALCELGPS